MKSSILSLFLLAVTITSLAQPANDDPCGAIAIPVGAPDYLGVPCIPTAVYSWSGATLTASPPNFTCVADGFSNIRDVWYKMEVPASGKITVSFNSADALFFVFYKASDCSSALTFTEAGCILYTNVNNDQAITLSSLTPNSTIYLRVTRPLVLAQSSGSVKICALESVDAVAINNSTRVGIGTTNPLAKLDVVGKAIVRDSLSVGKTLEVKENLKAKAIQLTLGAGAEKVLTSDANGNGSWVVWDSVFSSPWLYASADERDTSFDNTAYRVRHIVAPELTSYTLDNKLITVYFKVDPYVVTTQLPYTNEAGGATNQINCFLVQGKVLVCRHTFGSDRFNSGIAESYPGEPVMISSSPLIQYRYVIHN